MWGHAKLSFKYFSLLMCFHLSWTPFLLSRIIVTKRVGNTCAKSPNRRTSPLPTMQTWTRIQQLLTSHRQKRRSCQKSKLLCGRNPIKGSIENPRVRLQRQLGSRANKAVSWDLIEKRIFKSKNPHSNQVSYGFTEKRILKRALWVNQGTFPLIPLPLQPS